MHFRFTCLVIFTFSFHYGESQHQPVTPLFQSQEPLAVSISFSIRGVKKITNDTIYSPSQFSYKNEKGEWDTLNMSIRARGNFRRANCFFPPLRMKAKKKDIEGTLFSGNKSLKLVLPCQSANSFNMLVLKEYMCYQLYEAITPYIFKTRLGDLSLVNLDTKNSKTYNLKAFFIEDDDLVAKRFNGRIRDDLKMHPLLFHDTVSAIHDFFEYMISNTDWSAAGQHNIKVLQLPSEKYIPLTYDFDMAGLVNAPYATVSPMLEVTDVRQRVYRGFCRKESLLEFVRSEYIRLEPKIMAVTDRFENSLSPAELAGIRKYLGEFFSILKNDRAFRSDILQKCRTK